MARPTKLTPDRALVTIQSAADSGDAEASAWLRGEGHISVEQDADGNAYSRFVRFDGIQYERGTSEYKRWRSAVFERDGYKCQDCGAIGELNAHHVKSWAKYPTERFNVDNGRTVCRKCHARYHPHLNFWKRK